MTPHDGAGPFGALCAALARAALRLAVLGLVLLVLCVQWQVVGRYLLNDTPTWTEPAALLLVLYITALAVAVGVRDGTHLSLDLLAQALPAPLARGLAVLAQALVAGFAGLMTQQGWAWTVMKWDEPKPMLGVPEGLDYLPLCLGGALMLLFSWERLLALLRGRALPTTSI
jgi:TRAP-type C4-dicarboxylate transport system permease small subunit